MNIGYFVGFLLIMGLRCSMIIGYGPIITIFKDWIDKHIQENNYKVTTPLILAIIKQESSGDLWAVGKIGEVGLMQISQPALTDYNTHNKTNLSMFELFINPYRNLAVGIWYLEHLRIMFDNDLLLFVSAYNQGMGNVKRNTFSVSYFDSVNKHLKSIQVRI